jgi:SOS-response transcriptional repressor LexA
MLACMDDEATMRRRQEIGARIKQARLRAGLSQEGLGGMMRHKVSYGTVSNWEGGKVGVDLPLLEEIARILDQPLQYFTGQAVPRRDTEMEALGKEVVRLIERRGLANVVRADPTQVTGARVRAPVVNAIAASELMRHDRQIEETIAVPEEIAKRAQDPVAFIVVGECLRGELIASGDYLIVDQANKEPCDGEIVAARVNGEETAKCFYRMGDGRIELRPAGPGFETIVVTERDEFEIIGVYVGVIRAGRAR